MSNDYDLRRIFTASLYFLSQFSAIQEIKTTDDSNEETKYNELVTYLNKESSKKPSLFKLILTIALQLILTVIYYCTALSDFYLCYCFYKKSEIANLLLTCLWIWLPQIIFATGDLKALYIKFYCNKKEKLKFFYKSGLMFIVCLFKLNVSYGYVFQILTIK